MIKSVCSGTLCALALMHCQNAFADDCDFTTADAFHWQQVIGCFESVPFDHDNLENIVEVLGELRGYSDLDELFDARYNWRQNLSQLDDPATLDDYPNDFAMHNAIRLEHKQFRNLHVRYFAPYCYVDMLTAYMPFDFGMTSRFAGRDKQIVFIEDAPILPEIYEQMTGLDPTDYVGMKVVSINGIDTLEYFREYGRTRILADDTDGSHLNSILNRLEYTVRSSSAFDFAPTRPADEFVLQERGGKPMTVSFPWIFVKKSLLGQFQVPPTSSQQEFEALCQLENQLPFPSGGLVSSRVSGDLTSEIDPEKAALINRSIRGPSVHKDDYFEVPPGLFDREVDEIVPLTNGAKVLQYRDTTAIRFFNTLSWIDVARQGVEHACQNSDNLILDLRRNNGGHDIGFQWLYTHLFPDVDNIVEAGKIVFRARNDVPALNELLTAGAYLDYIFNSPCTFRGPGCFIDIATEQPIPRDQFQWNQNPSITENRGGKAISLSRETSFSEAFAGQDPEFDVASCSGKFEGDNLIILTDGTNCSGGYFFVSPFKENGKATVVTMGGYPNEEMSMGICRGGPTVPLNEAPVIANVAEFFGYDVAADIPSFNLNVTSSMEVFAAYRQNRVDLHFDKPMGYDLRIPVWSDSPETDGYVYQRVLDAVSGK